jgi:hypothetical protein
MYNDEARSAAPCNVYYEKIYYGCPPEIKKKNKNRSTIIRGEHTAAKHCYFYTDEYNI